MPWRLLPAPSTEQPELCGMSCGLVDHVCHKVGGNGLSALETPQVVEIPPLYPCRVFVTLRPSA